jgi:hypothetical protein
MLPITEARRGFAMTTTWVLMTDMAILVGIFALGFLAKSFPKNGRQDGAHHGSSAGSHAGSNRGSNMG